MQALLASNIGLFGIILEHDEAAVTVHVFRLFVEASLKCIGIVKIDGKLVLVQQNVAGFEMVC